MSTATGVRPEAFRPLPPFDHFSYLERHAPYEADVSTMRLLLMAWLLALVTAASADDSIEQAHAVFEAYVHGYRSFDANVVELYADAAIIQNTRRYPTGEVRQLRVPAPQYKAMVAQLMPEMRSRGDRSKYLDPVFSQEGAGVRVRLTRFSELKQYASPLSLLMGADTTGTWRILEELSESRP